ncbi:hypothetical protein [Streptomyces sp. NTH33]|uniref:hypothetical protein n=1 Tax=Streptomyces sp. NTH33 TaxID=1735453 RepID=UPI0015E877CE|nr:hypothetical protein [Streptomyces sp. NTH33]
MTATTDTRAGFFGVTGARVDAVEFTDGSAIGGTCRVYAAGLPRAPQHLTY